jgi:hypothetical protein
MSDKSLLPITDKLVEFAKQTVIQEQMTNSMNSIISNMRIPGAGNPMRKEDKPEKQEEGKPNEN